MALVEVDGLAADDGKLPEPIPAGPYNLQVSSVEETFSKEKEDGSGSKPIINLRLKVMDGDHEGRTLFHVLVLPNDKQKDEANKQCRSRLKRFINACGIKLEGDKFDPETFMGCQVKGIVSVSHDKEFGSKNKLKDVLSAE